jgi:ribosomal protein L7/L12
LEDACVSKYEVVVTAVPDKIVPLVKSLRLLADLGLKDAKELTDYLSANSPCVLVAGIDREVADHVATLLREAGASTAVGESSLSSPMLLCPQANHRYRWNWLGTRVQE